MKQQKISLMEGFFVGILFGGVIYWLLEEHKKSKKRIELLEKELDEGYQIDKFILDRDWQHIRGDINYSYEQLIEQTNYEK